MLLLGVERLRNEAREGFANTISGTDLIVGARGSPVSLLLYSVFRIGNATHNISWQSYQELSKLPQVRWAVPLSLGDSPCRVSRAGHDARVLRVLPARRGPIAGLRRRRRVPRRLRRGDWRRCRARPRLSRGAVAGRCARRGQGQLRRPRRQAVSRRRHPRQDRHAGGPDDPRVAAGHRGHPPGLAVGHAVGRSAGPGRGRRARWT